MIYQFYIHNFYFIFNMSNAKSILHSLSQAKIYNDNIINAEQQAQQRILYNNCVLQLNQYLDSLSPVTFEELKEFAKNSGMFRYDYMSIIEEECGCSMFVKSKKINNGAITLNSIHLNINSNISVNEVLRIEYIAPSYYYGNISIYYIIQYMQNKIIIDGLDKPQYEKINRIGGMNEYCIYISW